MYRRFSAKQFEQKWQESSPLDEKRGSEVSNAQVSNWRCVVGYNNRINHYWRRAD